jgi:hypothetical protein
MEPPAPATMIDIRVAGFVGWRTTTGVRSTAYRSPGHHGDRCQKTFEDLLICIDLSTTQINFFSAMPIYWRVVPQSRVVAASRVRCCGPLTLWHGCDCGILESQPRRPKRLTLVRAMRSQQNGRRIRRLISLGYVDWLPPDKGSSWNCLALRSRVIPFPGAS